MALEGFRVTRSLVARTATATRMLGTLTSTGAPAPPRAPSSLAMFRLDVADLLGGMTPSARGAVFADFRRKVAAVLDAYTVHAGPVDALTPPAYLLEWSDPWTIPSTACRELARLDIVCVAARIDVEPGVETLEYMVADALAALTMAGIAHGESTPPRPFQIGGVTYLACRIQVQNTVTIGA